MNDSRLCNDLLMIIYKYKHKFEMIDIFNEMEKKYFKYKNVYPMFCFMNLHTSYKSLNKKYMDNCDFNNIYFDSIIYSGQDVIMNDYFNYFRNEPQNI